MSIDGLFTSGELIDDASVGKILAEEAQEFETAMQPDDPDYMIRRKKLLGPCADVTDPEFGRPNRPEETYGVLYRAKETLVSRIIEVDDEGIKTYHPIHRYKVDEYIFDTDNNMILEEDL